jgi:hypothetical protein
MGKLQQILCCSWIHQSMAAMILKTCNIFKQEDDKRNGKQRIQSDKQVSWIFNGINVNYKHALRFTNEQLNWSSISLLSWIMNPTLSSTKPLLYIVYHPSYSKEVKSQVVALDCLFSRSCYNKVKQNIHLAPIFLDLIYCDKFLLKKVMLLDLVMEHMFLMLKYLLGNH